MIRRVALAVVVAIAAVGALVAAPGAALAQPQHLDMNEQLRGTGEAPEVILLTFGEGVQIFEKYGHGALCLHYPTAPVYDIPPRITAAFQSISDSAKLSVGAMASVTCFNYGITNFRDGPAIVWNFLRGKQKFWVDTESMLDMVAFYSGKTPLARQLQEDRDVWMQRLPLTAEQAHRIEAKLFSDIKEENRYYIYDHFFDNCTTRLRDMIDDATDHKFRVGDDKPYGPTFREMGYRGVAETWPLVGYGDFYAGRQLDDHPDVWAAMFHPDVIRAQVEEKLGVKPVQIYTRSGPPFPQTGNDGHVYLFLIALGFAAPLLAAKLLGWGRRATTAAVAFGVLYIFVWGLVVWTAAIVSSIPGLRWNENVLVFVPFDIALPFLGESKRRSYARVRVGLLLLVSLLDVVGVLRQPLWIPILTAFMPLALLAFDLPRLRAPKATPAKPDAKA